jgi:hypothetical protein
MFQEAGYSVGTARRLSPALERADVIVWAPDDFQPPRSEVQQFLEEWLWDREGRTLVYIGRDFDAAVLYWEMMAVSPPADQALEVRQRLASKRSQHAAARLKMPEEEDAQWFISRRRGQRRTVQSLRGPWSQDIDTSKAQIELEGHLALPADSTDGQEPESASAAALLESDGVVLVSRFRRPVWGDSQILVVTNGSFLLNLPLVNPEHRKLAGRLIDQCGPAGRVVFLESGPGGPGISLGDAEQYPLLAAFTVWPVGGILLHLILVGIVFCLSVFPIFGRARELAKEDCSDFGSHVRAVGQLLERTGDRQDAQARLAQYHEALARDVRPGPSRSGSPFATSRSAQPNRVKNIT